MAKESGIAKSVGDQEEDDMNEGAAEEKIADESKGLVLMLLKQVNI